MAAKRERDPREPRPDEDPAAGLSDEERARIARRLSRLLQAGGAAFLAVVSLGLLPGILSTSSPALGRAASIAVWVIAPAVPIALLVFAALRLRR